MIIVNLIYDVKNIIYETHLKQPQTCIHLKDISKNANPRTKGCEECEKIGSSWVHLRRCLMCGHVGCCDSSVHKHATKHFNEIGHSIMQSFEPGEDWKWCYIDEIYLK